MAPATCSLSHCCKASLGLPSLGAGDILAPGSAPLWASGRRIEQSQAHLLRWTASDLFYSAFCCCCFFPSLCPGNIGHKALLTLSLSFPNLSGVLIIFPSSLRTQLPSRGFQKCLPSLCLPNPHQPMESLPVGPFSRTHHTFFQVHGMCLELLPATLRPGFCYVIPPLWQWTLRVCWPVGRG